MSENGLGYSIYVPENFVGVVTAELHKRMAWINAVKSGEGRIVLIEFWLDLDRMEGLEEWLRITTNGQGVIKINHP